MSTAQERGLAIYEAGGVRQWQSQLTFYWVEDDSTLPKSMRSESYPHSVESETGECSCGWDLNKGRGFCKHAWAVAFYLGLDSPAPAPDPPARPRRSVDEELAELF